MEAIKRILVMGSGPGGLANAAVLSKRGYSVCLYSPPDYPSDIEQIKRDRKIEIEGALGEDIVDITTVTSDLDEAFQHNQLILISVPAFAQRDMMERSLPYLRSGHVILLMPGSAGSLEGAVLFQRAGLSLDEVLLGETVSLPQAARRLGERRVRLALPAKLRAAAFPGRNTPRLVEAVGDAIELIPKTNVLEPGLNNPNFIIHPGPMLLNYAAVERCDGYLSLMNEGMTDGVLRLMDAVDAEKMSLQKALGTEVMDIDSVYVEKGAGAHVYRTKGEPFGIRDRIWDRYIEEDVPYGTALFASLGDLLGIETPVCDAINRILSAVKQKDYQADGRNLTTMGLAGMSPGMFRHYLLTGERKAPEAMLPQV